MLSNLSATISSAQMADGSGQDAVELAENADASLLQTDDASLKPKRKGKGKGRKGRGKKGRGFVQTGEEMEEDKALGDET